MNIAKTILFDNDSAPSEILMELSGKKVEVECALFLAPKKLKETQQMVD